MTADKRRSVERADVTNTQSEIAPRSLSRSVVGVRRAELAARAALEAHDPGAWELLAAATARRRMLREASDDECR